MLAPVPPLGGVAENPLLARVDELERGLEAQTQALEAETQELRDALRVEARKREALEQRLARRPRPRRRPS